MTLFVQLLVTSEIIRIICMSFVGTFFRNSFQKIYTRLTTYQDFNKNGY